MARLEHVDCRGSGMDEIEADAANTEVVEPLQFGVGDGRIDHRHAAGSRAELGHRIEMQELYYPSHPIAMSAGGSLLRPLHVASGHPLCVGSRHAITCDQSA
jgi:hypothetical protein